MKRRTTLSATLAVTLIVGLCQVPAAYAAKTDPYVPSAAPVVPDVPVKVAQIKQPAPEPQPAPASARPAPVWPGAGVTEVDLTGSGTSRAAGSVVQLSAPAAPATARAATPGPTRVRLEVLDHAAAERAGVRGVALRLGRADGVTAVGRTKVTVDYRSFATAYGADWASRLRLVSLPDCALTTPGKRECAGTPLVSKNDPTTQSVSAEAPVGGARTLLAAMAGASGATGDYSASTLNPSATWSAGGNTGAFSWTYPMRIPPGIGGPAPQVNLSYSSQSVDGQHAASNNQPSWTGEGFGESFGGFVERRYQTCGLDMDGSANNDKKTGDICWETNNATLSLPGHSGELIYNAGEDRWHLRTDDGTRVQRKTGATNGDDDGEHWLVTTPDGMQYWFGRNRLPGWTAAKPLTNSALTAPVFGNDPSEPCHATKFADSGCTQAWRWNLDYVVDPSGNSMSYWYTKETNKYGRNLDPDDDVTYDRSSYLDRIDYGTRQISGTDSVLNTTAPLRVDFQPADRCLADCGEHDAVHWPDVPWDSSCTGASCPDQFAPTFFSAKRLATVTTQVRNGTSYRDVERWTLKHLFPDPGDTSRAGLWLSALSHVGLVGGSKTVPDIEFTPVSLANRVDKVDFAEAMRRMRITKIRTETGGTTSINYSDPECTPDGKRPAPQSNTGRCYPVRWEPEGYDEPVTDWFNKYVVKTIFENNNTGGTPPNGSPRVVYSYTYLDGAAWHYTDDDGLVKKKYKTWSDFRGYGRVGVTVGDPGEQTYTETRYFRGMNGDRDGTPTGVRPASVDGIADEDWYAGMTRESTVLNGPNGAVVSRTVSTPWASAPTASRTINGDTVASRFTATGAVTHHTTLDGGRGERVTKTVTTYDDYGMPVAVDDLGQDGVAGDEQCTKINYLPRNTTAWMLDRVHRTQAFAVKCADTTGTLTENDVISDTRTVYDDKADYTVAATRGLATRVETMDKWNNGAPTFITAGRTGYDVHGRVTSSTNALNYKTTTAFTPVSDGPVTATSTKNPALHETKVTVEPAWGLPTSTVDPNDKRTDVGYDPFGRLTAVWPPGRTKDVDKASTTYDYDLNVGAATVVTTSTLNAAGDYISSYSLYDGMLRLRETQAPSPSGGRIISESFYDTAGRPVLAFGGYHTTGAAGGTLLAATDRAFVPRQTRTVYDGAGRATAQVFQPYGFERWRTTAVDGGDRTDVTPPTGGMATSTVTDSRGRTVELRQYHGATPTPGTAGSWDATKYTFDRRGYLTKIADTLGNDWNYTYDVRGRQTHTDDPDKGTTDLTYDNLGQVLTSTDQRGKKLAYLYDSLGRTRAVYDNDVSGNMRAQWKYDDIAKGHLSQSTRFVGSAPYQSKIINYNDRYQPGDTQIIIPESETGLAGTYDYNTTYNSDGSIKSTSLPGTNTDLQPEALTYGYDTFGQPTTLTSLYGGQHLSYVEGTDYNALAELDQVKLWTGTGGRVFVKYGRELETGRLTNIRTDRDSVAPYILNDTTYQYDKAGNITKSVDASADPVDDSQCFTYDHLNRLTQAWTPGNGDCAATPSSTALGGPAPYWNSWQFDETGNRTRAVEHRSDGDAVTDYKYPAPGPATVRPHALTSTTGAQTGSYTYDVAGNMLTRPTASAGAQTMTWDPEGHLATSADATGTTTYIYDADGNRLIRRDPGGRTLYLPGQEIRSTSTGTTATRYYGHSGGMIASRTNTGISWLSGDHQGTANVAVDAVTQRATTRRQTPYGVLRGATMSWPNDKGMVGGTNDNTGLTHLGAREYDPQLGRFISVDPVQELTDPQQWNGYAYSHNNPVTFSDPSGLSDCDFAAGCNGVGRSVDPRDNDDDNPNGAAPGGGRTEDDSPTQQGGCGRQDGCDPTPENGTAGNGSGSIDSPPKFATFAVTYSGGCGVVSYQCSYGDLTQQQKSYAFGEYLCRFSNQCDLQAALEKADTDQFFDILSWVPYLGAASAIYFAKQDFDNGDPSGAVLEIASITPVKAKYIAKAVEGFCSFSGDTKVLLDGGKTKRFEDLAAGDEVLAADPETGEQGLRKVEKVWIHDDDLYVLTIDGERLVTTEDHPFWDETDRQWEGAQQLDPGDLVRTPHGTARVDGFDKADHRYAAAYNLTVAGLHTYFVLAGQAAVLVHNQGGLCPVNKQPHGAMGQAASLERLQNAGYTKIISEPQFKSASGQTFRADFIAESPQGRVVVIDAKVNSGGLTGAQEIGYPDLANGRATVYTSRLEEDYGLRNGDPIAAQVGIDHWICPVCE